MNVSGKILYEKIEYLRPDLSTSITPDIFDKICDISTVQPFLEWFCTNVSRANVLTKEELYLKNKLENTDEWLSGKELDEALEELTRDNPELLELIDFEDENVNEKFAELESLKDLYKMDEDYEKLLKNNILNLKELEYSLEDKIEQEENNYEKERIELLKSFNDCNDILEKFDEQNRSFSRETEQLLNVYTDAIESKGLPILWIQMPIDLFIKQIKLYNDYLDILIKREFSVDNQEVEQQQQQNKQHDSDYETFINDSKERQILTHSKLKEVYMKMHEASYRTMLEHACLIWNDGNLKLLEQTHFLDEIVDLNRRRDFLEENITLLRERQLPEVIEQYVETAIIQVLQQALLVRLRRRQTRFDKLKSLLSFTREHGHAYSDLLCILMDSQFHSLKEISEFIANARHYLTTEYSLSSSRCEIMQQQQEEYATVQGSIINQNIFNELFISMMSINDVSSDALNHALVKYNDLISSNKEKKQFILDTYIKNEINRILESEKEVLNNYDKERNIGITRSFVPLSYKLNVQYHKTLELFENVKTHLTTVRNALKEKMRNNNDLEKDKDILWQRFLTDPETLRKHYEETKRMADRSHFGKDTS
ncbi:PREDICTED: HAUS augmin-like complex subunit 3 isoform X2 [Polistes dominula]|uniref:HAUS augmin-like complex subunit 3 isoform X2 n=1 Tax=Polistes dominula TaxID=743375 RepID=A0ABM1J207_POLDO|nr:PREDICTED: HAUS augmin-like complex subunit 3 isoform X2 [Polistes dominula]